MALAWELFVQTAYAIPILIIYVIILCILLRPRNGFQSSFFHLSVAVGVVDILCYFSFYLNGKLAFNKYTCPFIFTLSGTYFLTFAYFCCYALPHMREVLILGIALNRLTALLRPQSYEKIWKWAFWVTLGVAIVAAFPGSWYILFGTSVVVPYDEACGVDVKFYWFPVNKAFNNFVQILVGSTVALAVNLCTLWYLLSTRTMHGKYQRVAFRRAEKSLFLVSLSDFCCSSLWCIHQMLVYIVGSTGPTFKVIWYLVPYVIDFTNLSRPLVLLFMCLKVRIAFLRVFGLRLTASGKRRAVVSVSVRVSSRSPANSAVHLNS